LIWISVGYLHGSSFPGVSPAVWRGRPVSYLRAAFLGVVDATDGTLVVYERGPADPITSAWATIARGMVRPATEMPAALAEDLHYPRELLEVQGRVLQRAHWGIGLLEPVRTDTLAGPVQRLHFVEREHDRIVAVVEASHRRGQDELRLVRFDSLASLDSPALLAQRWERLPYVSQMADSVRVAGRPRPPPRGARRRGGRPGRRS
jgi:hypothetical protein